MAETEVGVGDNGREYHEKRIVSVYNSMADVAVEHGVSIAHTPAEKSVMFRAINLVANWMTANETARSISDADIMLALSVAIHVMAEMYLEFAHSTGGEDVAAS